MANVDTPEQSRTRMLFLGEDSLADGLRLIGFETHADPRAEDVDQVFRELLKSRDRAFVLVDERVMRSGAANLARVRREGGRIVVVAVPPLAGPVQLQSEVADRLAALFGSGNLAPQE
ncbi:MAG: ATPase [Thiohalocapsa sp.]|jgi:vacuolar-type H+-ATPase subunit F/Vma7|uniref:V-type ATP synthase subunit F n=1 Tax=Thiohalocapsa sp. TaxID=2497641 RepID=UPI0025CF08D9|nr:V-type ATP synthase subunit F [Thiohalocapsa sp.]MCG6940256.1 ATPase [Thiohalocapsa sp.]